MAAAEADPVAGGPVSCARSVPSERRRPQLQTIRRIVFLASLLAASLIHAQDLQIGKTGPEQGVADSDVAYEITVLNGGPGGALSVQINDALPAGLTFVSQTQNSGPTFLCAAPAGNISCTIATLSAGASASFTFVFHIPAGTAPGTFFTNIATVSSETADPNDENNSASAFTSTPPPPQGDLVVQKSGPGAAAPDTDIPYDITLANAGPDAAGNVVLTDVLPAQVTFVSFVQNSGPSLSCAPLPPVGSAGTITCTAVSFASGAIATFTLTTHLSAGATSGTFVSNTATVSSQNDPTEENNAASVTTVVSAVDASVTKTGPASANAGSDLSYTLTVTNAGPDTANVNLFDPLPPGTTFVSLMQNSGSTALCSAGTANCSVTLATAVSAQFTLVVNAGAATSVTNTATVTTEQFDTDPSNNEDSVITAITPVADVSVTKAGPANVTAGANATYTITVANAGPSAAANVALTDAVPANTTLVTGSQSSGPSFACSFPPAGAGGTITCTNSTLAAGASATFSLTVQVSAATAAGTSIANTADVTTTTTDPDSADRTSTTTATVVTAADVTVAKSGPATLIAGTNVTYTVSVTNSGPSNAATVSLTDSLPASTTFVSADQTAGSLFNCGAPAPGGAGTITCTASTMPPGTATFQFVLNVSPNARGSLTNTASVSSSTDSNGGNNSSDATATVLPPSSDVTVGKTASRALVAPGSTVTYTIVVTNIGSFAASGTTVTDVLPAQLTLTSATSTQGTCVGTTTILCTVGNLEPAASATITIVATVSVAASGAISNTATASDPNDRNPGNNSGTAVINAVADIPTLSSLTLLMLSLLFASAGMFLLRNR